MRSTNNPINHFNIRVYGIIIKDHNQVLVSDEYMLDRYMTKFPGGGLRFGEGPEDCIKREALEEFSQEIEIIEHFYTTGFFQKAEFFKDHQLLSIYYRIRFKEPPAFKISDTSYDFPSQTNGSQSFRWLSLNTLQIDELTFPIDRKVAEMLKVKFSQGLL